MTHSQPALEPEDGTIRSAAPILCVLPARGGSKGVPRKNMRELAGQPLIAWALSAALGARDVHVLVSTDDPEIAAFATSLGAGVHRRSPETSGDSSTTESVLQEVLTVEGVRRFRGLALIQPTSPLLEPRDVDRAVALWLTAPTQSVVSVARRHHFRWSADGTPLNYSPANRPRRQDWEGELYETGALYLTSVSNFIRHGHRCPPPVRLLELAPDKAIEIDTDSDLVVAAALLRRRELEEGR